MDQDEEQKRRAFEQELNILKDSNQLKKEGFVLYDVENAFEIHALSQVEMGTIYYTKMENKVFRNSSTEIQVSNEDLGETVSIPVSNNFRNLERKLSQSPPPSPSMDRTAFSRRLSIQSRGSTSITPFSQNHIQTKAELYLEKITGKKLISGIELTEKDSQNKKIIYSLDEISSGVRYFDEKGHRISKMSSGTILIHNEAFQVTKSVDDKPFTEEATPNPEMLKEELDYFDKRMERVLSKKSNQINDRLGEYMNKYCDNYQQRPAKPLLDSVDDAEHHLLMESDFIKLLRDRISERGGSRHVSESRFEDLAIEYDKRFDSVKQETEQLFRESPVSFDRQIDSFLDESGEESQSKLNKSYSTPRRPSLLQNLSTSITEPPSQYFSIDDPED